MNKIYVFLGLTFYGLAAMGCDCFENNHAIRELDEYAIINAQLAVVIETGDVMSDGENIVLKANIVSYIKKSPLRTIYLKGQDEKEFGFELTKMANKTLLFIEIEPFGDTILVNHCKRLWVWYVDPNKMKGTRNYFRMVQPQFAVTSFLDKSYMQNHYKIKYTNNQNTSMGKYKDGLPEGRWTHFTYHGKIYARGTYAEGVREGKWIEEYYTQKENGNEITLHKAGFAKGNYVNGEREGKWVIYNKHNGTVTLFYRGGQIFEKRKL